MYYRNQHSASYLFQVILVKDTLVDIRNIRACVLGLYSFCRIRISLFLRHVPIYWQAPYMVQTPFISMY